MIPLIRGPLNAARDAGYISTRDSLNRQPLRYEKAGFPRGLGEDDGCLKNNIHPYAKLRMAKDDAVRWAPSELPMKQLHDGNTRTTQQQTPRRRRWTRGGGDELLETVDREEQLDSGNVASLKGSTA